MCRIVRRPCAAGFVLTTIVGACWALATPIFASPDEQSHVIHAVAVARGELIGRDVPQRARTPDAGNAEVYVTVPGVYRNGGGMDCLKFFRPEVTADCLHLSGSSGDARAVTYTARYFPAYYAFVGLGTAWYPPGAGQVYLMRLLNVLVVAALLASCAVTLAKIGSALASVGVFTAITPMVLFLAGSVNGSGIEIAAAVGVWCHGSALATRQSAEPDRAVLRRLLIAVSVLCLTRPLSPAWSVLALVLLAWLAGFERARQLARTRGARAWAALAAACFGLQVAWVLWKRPFDYQVEIGASGSTPTIVRHSLGRAFELVREMIGVFGWLDTPAPMATILIVLMATGALIGLGLMLAPRRAIVTVGLAILATVLIPIVIESANAHKNGFLWQGRYTLPIGVSVPILAGMTTRIDDRLRAGVNRVAVVLAGVLVLGQGLAFAQALRRYSVGLSGPLWFIGRADWDPPVPSLVLMLLLLGALGVAAAWCRPRPSAPARQ